MGTSTGSSVPMQAKTPVLKQFISKLRSDPSAYVSYYNGTVKVVLTCHISYCIFWPGARMRRIRLGRYHAGQGYLNWVFSYLPEVDPLSDTSSWRKTFTLCTKEDCITTIRSALRRRRWNTGDHVDGGTSRLDANGKHQAICANRVGFKLRFFSSRNAYGLGLNGGSGL
jgi:hypothetical protein